MKYTSIVTSCLIGAVLGQPSLLCVDDTSTSYPIVGTYNYFDDENGYSIWVQNSTEEAYIIYFTETLGNVYTAWGLWRCNELNAYTEADGISSDKYPGNKDDCNGDPVVFCPALDEDQLSTFGIDGQDNGDYTWYPDDFPHPYNCTRWYEYANDATYFTSRTVDYIPGLECEDDDTNSNSNNNGVAAPGEKTDNGSDSESSTGMSSGAKTVLWVILSLLMVASVGAACYFGYHWRQKHLAETATAGVGFQPPMGSVVSQSEAERDGVALETGA